MKALTATVALLLLLLTTNVPGGTGTFREVQDGVYVLDFCVSVRFDATAQQLARIETVVEGASDVLADATDGKVRFGRISIFDNSKASSEAEIWIEPVEGQANAINGFYGVRGAHVEMFYPNNFDNDQLQDPPDEPSPFERYYYTIPHEMAHSIWRVLDEYSGPFCGQQCECEPLPGSMDATYCLMDNYYIRGGNIGADPTGTGTYTLNEFCVESNHDPDEDTNQEFVWHMSCWERIESHPLRAVQLAGNLPVDNPPNVPAPTFETLSEVSRFSICFDRSGSMDNTDTGDGASRLNRAKQGANIFINCLRGGDWIGFVPFATVPDDIFPLTEVDENDEETTKDAVKDHMLVLPTEGSSTAIGLGLEESQNQLTGFQPSCNQPIILLTDGFSNDGPSELDLIDSLIDDRIPVTTLAIGEEPKVDALMELSRRTGGQHYHVVLDSDLPQTCSYMYADSAGIGVIAAERGHTNDPNPSILVDDLTDEVLFIFSWNNPDTVFDFALVAPDSSLINELGAGADPDVDFFDGITQKVFRIRNAQPGDWSFQFVILAGGATALDFIALSSTPDLSLVAMPIEPITSCGVTDAEIRIVAAPMLQGRPLLGVSVTGTMMRPDGTTQAVTLLDDGGVASGDDIADDGEYAVREIPTVAGTYSFQLVAENTAAEPGVTYAGEALFLSVGDVSTDLTPPLFTRTVLTTAVAVPSDIAGDIDGDGMIDVVDLLRLLAVWGPCSAPPCSADFDCDGQVGITDLLKMLQNWTG